MIEAIAYCHLHGVKLYMTVNTLLKNRELEDSLFSFLLPYYEAGLDAVIVQDVGVLRTDCPGEGTDNRGTVTDAAGNGSGDGSICSWCPVLLLFRPVSF